MKQTVKTSRAAGQLEKMFRVLNQHYFEGKLPEPIISLKKTPSAYGHITCAKVWQAGEESKYEINISSATLNRPIEDTTATLLHEMVHEHCLESGIHDFSRLARSTRDLLEIVERLQAKGVHLVSNKENLDTGTPTGKLMLTMIAAINEFERQNLLDRQREGIAIAKRNGIYKGRKKVAIPDNFTELYARYTRREMNKGQLAEALHVTRPTLERMIREHLETAAQI